jgi:ATP-dependent protease ClpP protease subunit
MANLPIFHAKTDGVLEVHVNDEIGFWGITASDVINQIEESGKSKVTLRINSVGGSVDDALAIYNYLKDSDYNVTTKVDGIAASAATVILQAANPKKRYLSEGAVIMTHEASVNAGGKKADLMEMVKALDVVNESIKSIYVSNGVSNEDANKLLYNGDTWLTSAEAIEYGLADKLYNSSKEAKATAYQIAAKANNIPEEVLSKLNNTMENVEKSRFDQIVSIVKGEKTDLDVVRDEFTAQITAINEENEAKIVEFKNQIEALSEEKASLEAKINDLNVDTDSFTDKIVSLENENKELAQKLAEFQAKDESKEESSDVEPSEQPNTPAEVSGWDKVAQEII